MLGNLFRKRDSHYSASHTYDSPMSSPLQHSNNYTSSSYSGNFSNPMDDFTADSTTILNQGSDNINDQSNLYMPALFGLNSAIPKANFRISDKSQCIRMLIFQDAGIRSKQPLFDSAVTLNGNLSAMHQKINKSIHHPSNELSTFMFGCYGMVMSEYNITTKLHYLPSLPGMPSSVLITRLFSLEPSFQLKPLNTESLNNSDWEPCPIFSMDELPKYENISTRFAIGLVVPVSYSIESVRDEITENWSEISNSLTAMQKIIIMKMKLHYNLQKRLRKSQNQHMQLKSSPIVNNNNNLNTKKFKFNVYCLQSEMEIYQCLLSFTKLIISMLEIPRLFIDLKNSNQALISWASTVSAWLELKDGRIAQNDDSSNGNHSVSFNDHNSTTFTSFSSHYNQPGFSQQNHGIKFLAHLISVLLPLRSEIFKEPMAGSSLITTRVVIGTGNPIVSQKLIFIIAGLLGYEIFSILQNGAKALTLVPKSDNIKNQEEKRKKDSENSFCSVPIPIQKNSDETDSDSLNLRPSYLCQDSVASISPQSQCWEIPTKASAMISESPSVSSISAASISERVPIPRLNRTSSYASLQNLSTSYGGAQPTSSSWRNSFQFGSFMERWKVSNLVSSPSTSHTSNSPNPETPSPGIEYDEYPWQASRKPLPIINSSAASTASNSSFATSYYKPPTAAYSTPIKKCFNYVSHDHFSINRTASNLLSSDFQTIEREIAKNIDYIMTDDFSTMTETHSSGSVLSIDQKNNHNDENNLSGKTITRIPMLVGYIPLYRPEFSLMSCAVNTNQESVLIESMKDDVLRTGGSGSSKLYFVNLGMRRIKLLEVNGHEIQASNDVTSLGSSKLSKSSLTTNADDDFNEKFKSKLTKDIDTGLQFKQKTIFSPSKSFKEEPGLGISTQNDIIDKYDAFLNQIALTINSFFSDLKEHEEYDSTDNQEKLETEKEEECCFKIRGLIEDLISLSNVES